jgi:nucleoside-diphosphate-sugar epimerase
MKKLLVTGTGGFIGKRLTELISQRFPKEYRVIPIKTKNKKYNLLPCLSCPKPYEKTWEDIYALLHIGAFTPKSPDEVDLARESNSNITNTQYLLDRLPHKPQKIIFASTLDVYRGTNTSRINEDTETTPASLYGWSKLYCEKMLEAWAKKNDVTLQILRIGHVYGKGDESYKKIIPETIRRIKENKNPQVTGNGLSKRSLIHVDDVCRLILKSLPLTKYEGPINICSSRPLTIKEILKKIIKIYKKDLEIQYTKPHYKQTDLVFDTSKMNKLLGEESIRLEDGLKRYEENEC